MSFDAFSGAMPTYSWKTVVPTKVGNFFSSEVPPGMKHSPLDLIRQAMEATGQTLQESQLNLVVSGNAGKAGPNQPMTVHVSLENTNISSGVMMYNANDLRGYYQDQVEIGMYLSADGGRTPMAEFSRVSDGPQTVNGTGSTSSSVSVSFSAGVSANIGFFGGTATGGAGASGSVSMSNTHSFARSLMDFKVVNKTQPKLIQHLYKMSQSTGGAYEKAEDLVPSGDDMGFEAAFKGIKLHHPPDLATSNLPIISQAVWQAQDAREFDQTIHAVVKVVQRVVKVEGTNNFGAVDMHSEGRKFTYWHREPISLKPFKATDEGAAPPPVNPF